MHADVDARLQEAADRELRRQALVRKREHLATQLHEAAVAVDAAENDCVAEEDDVHRLQRASFSSLLAAASGRTAERRAKELAEAYAARLRRDGCRARVRALRAELAAIDSELGDLVDAAETYDRALSAKETALQRAGDGRSAELSSLGEQYAKLCAELRELRQAEAAGQAAAKALTAVAGHLDGAQSWSVADMLGLDIFADAVEHDLTDSARAGLWHAQHLLDGFSRELHDVGVAVRPRLTDMEPGRMVDMFFDNLITDWMRHRKINDSADQVYRIRAWLDQVLRQLGRRRAAVTEARDDVVRRRLALLAPTGHSAGSAET